MSGILERNIISVVNQTKQNSKNTEEMNVVSERYKMNWLRENLTDYQREEIREEDRVHWNFDVVYEFRHQGL